MLRLNHNRCSGLLFPQWTVSMQRQENFYLPAETQPSTAEAHVKRSNMKGPLPTKQPTKLSAVHLNSPPSFLTLEMFFSLYTISSILYSSVLWRRSINHEKSTPPPPPLYLSNVSTQNGTGLFSMRYSSTASNVRSPSELVSVMLESTLSQLNVLNWQWFTQLKEDSNQYV